MSASGGDDPHPDDGSQATEEVNQSERDLLFGAILAVLSTTGQDTLRNLGYPEQEIDDLNQMISLEILSKSHLLEELLDIYTAKGPEGITPYLLHIRRCRAIDHLRRLGRSQTNEAGCGDFDAIGDRQQSPELMECKLLLREELDRLEPDQRKVVYLHYMEGWTLGEIAVLSGLSIATLSETLKRARQRLKKQLHWRGIEF